VPDAVNLDEIRLRDLDAMIRVFGLQAELFLHSSDLFLRQTFDWIVPRLFILPDGESEDHSHVRMLQLVNLSAAHTLPAWIDTVFQAIQCAGKFDCHRILSDTFSAPKQVSVRHRSR
jgi:hypothetical protein